MTPIESIDHYLDSRLSAQQAHQLEEELQHDADLRRLLDSVTIAREAIRSGALRVRMKQLHEEYMKEIEIERTSDNTLPMYRKQSFTWALRIAASLLLGVTAYSSYEFTVLDANRYYETKFMPYRLPVTRGHTENVTTLDSLYSASSYAAVIGQFTHLTVKFPRDYFLTAMSHLQQGQFDQAIVLFNTLRQYDTQRNTDYFHQETDYYLALAYLGANQVDEALVLFERIYNAPQHLFYQTVNKRDLIRLKILLAKQ